MQKRVDGILISLSNQTQYCKHLNEILQKDSHLTVEETQILSENTRFSLELLGGVPDFEELTDVIRCLDEHYDGSGSPLGLGADQIPLHARIIAVANAYDEMVTPRPSVEGFDHATAIERLRSGAGKRFDPEVVTAFCELNAAEHLHTFAIGGKANYYELISQHAQVL